jgi:hypothetical protein
MCWEAGGWAGLGEMEVVLAMGPVVVTQGLEVGCLLQVV